MVDIYRVFHSTTRQYTFFSAAHGTFSKIDLILGHKASLKKINNYPLHHIIPQQNKQQQKKPRKYSNTWRLTNTLLKNQWMTE
jgi:hypothetical protein